MNNVDPFRLSKEDSNIPIQVGKGDGSAGSPGGMEIVESYHLNPYVRVEILKDLRESRMLYRLSAIELGEEERRALIRIRERLLEMSSERVSVPHGKGRAQYLEERIEELARKEKGVKGEDGLNRIKYLLLRDFLGYGKIDEIMGDSNVEDISCDGAGIPLYIYHRKYQNMRTNVVFEDERELNNFIVLLAQRGNRQVSVSDPILDATANDGSRINATFGREVTSRGGTFTIRLFRKVPLTPVDLVSMNTASPELMAYLWLAIERGKNVLFYGGTGVGKTSTLNAVSFFLPQSSKIVSIEDTREINIPHSNWISEVTRRGVGEGRFTVGKAAGEIDMFDLLVSALRQRPDYLIVGEVRGREAYNLFQAMNVGQTTLATVHAESVENLISRLENQPIGIPRTMLTSMNVLVKQSLIKVEGRAVRRITEVSEMGGIDPSSNEITLNNVFKWDQQSDTFSLNGESDLMKEIELGENGKSAGLSTELDSRSELLRLLSAGRVEDPKAVWSYLVRYSTEKERVLSELRDLAERKGGSLGR